jgi:DNA polymerase-3 subunit gamma/tau
MSYQVTARKWRPQTFDDVVEQQHVTRTLKNAIQLNRVAHAYLFAGTRGVGKTTMARVLAKALNCDRGPTPEPCGACTTCVEITQGASMDIVEIDGASNRGIDEIRDLREALRYLPSRGRYKIYIIDEVHMLTKEAFNALLKTLEEPPPHVVFIFATTELDKIPYTILSRCQRFEFKRVSLSGIVSHLDHIVQREGLSIPQASLLRVAKAAEGSMRDAQSLLDQVVAYCGTETNDDDVGYLLGSVGSETLARCLSALFQQDAETVLHTADELQAEGHEATAILRALQEGLRHLIVLKTTAEPGELIPLSEADLETLRPVADMASVEEIYGHFQVLSQAEQSLRSASNPFLVLEMALVRVARIGRVQPLERILETLRSLEPGLPAPGSETARTQSSELLPGNGGTRLQPSSLTVSESVYEPESSGLRSVQQAETEPAAATPTAEPDEEIQVAPTDFWQALQDYVMDRRPSIGSLLQPGQVMSHNETVLVIGFAKEDSFNRSSLMDRDNLDVVREAAEAVGGRPVQVKIVALDDPQAQRGQDNGAGEASAQQAGDSTRADLQQQKRETIQAVLDIFDGTIIT